MFVGGEVLAVVPGEREAERRALEKGAVPDERRGAAFHRGVFVDRRRVVQAVDVQAGDRLADEAFGEAGGVTAGGLEMRPEGGRADRRVAMYLFEKRLFEVEGAGHGRQAPGGAFGRSGEGAGALLLTTFCVFTLWVVRDRAREGEVSTFSAARQLQCETVFYETV